MRTDPIQRNSSQSNIAPHNTAVIHVSPRGANRASWAQAWLLQRRAASATVPIHLVVSNLRVAADVLHPLLLNDRVVDEHRRRHPDAAQPICLFNVHRHTLDLLVDTLARQEMARRYWAPTTATVRQALVGRVLHEVQGHLRHFAPVAHAPGFFRTLARTLDELRQHRVPPSRLGVLGQEGEELALMLSSYEQSLEREHLVDRARLFAIATEELNGRRVRAAEADQLGDVILVDVPLRYVTELDFVAELGRVAGVSGATAPHGDSITLTSLTSAWPGATLEDDRHGAKRTALDRLQRQLFSTARQGGPQDETTTIFSAATAPAECTEIARRVLQQVRSGVPAEHIAVVVREAEPYVDLMVEALARAGIGVYPAEGAYRPDPAGRAFLLLLRCRLEDLPASRFAEYLSLDQIPGFDTSDASQVDASRAARPDLDDDADQQGRTPQRDFYAPAGWERLLRDAAVVGGIERWRRRIAGLQRELAARLRTAEASDPARARAIERDQADLEALARFALPLLTRLSGLPKSASWGEWIAALIPVVQSGLRRPQRVLELLEELRPLAHTGPVELHRVVDALSHRLSDLRRASPAHRYGRVYLGLAHELGGRSFDVVFIPGIAERTFPKKLLQDPVLLDRLRDRLNQGHALEPLLPLARERRLEERLALHLAVGAAKQAVTLSYPRMDIAQGQPRVPSFYLLEAARAVTGELPEFERLMADAAMPTQSRGVSPLGEASAVEDAIDAQQYDAAVLAEAEQQMRQPAGQGVEGYCAHLHCHPFLIRALRAHWVRSRRKLTAQDGLVLPQSDTGATPELLCGDRLTARPYAPTTLERYGRCPYQFYLAGVLGLRPRPRTDLQGHQHLDAQTRGRLLHEVQFELFRTLRQRALLPLDLRRLPVALELLTEQFEAISERYREELSPEVDVLWRHEMHALAADLAGWVRREATHQSDYEPVHFELSFGLMLRGRVDDASTSDPIRLGPHLLRGSIDLVERGPQGTLRVTDYKSGKSPTVTGGILHGGSSLQRVLYGLAVEALLPGQSVTDGRLYYCTERGGYREATMSLDERARADAASVLETIDHAIENGLLPAVPRPSARGVGPGQECDRCDYLRVCGRGGAQRANHKRHDKRLEPLKRVWRL